MSSDDSSFLEIDGVCSFKRPLFIPEMELNHGDDMKISCSSNDFRWMSSYVG